MSHAEKADKLLIKPAAGARPAPPRTRGQFIPKARTRRPVTRRVTRGTATTRLATSPDRPTRRVLPSPERGVSAYRGAAQLAQSGRDGVSDQHHNRSIRASSASLALSHSADDTTSGRAITASLRTWPLG